jgi:hypothetical protein
MSPPMKNEPSERVDVRVPIDVAEALKAVCTVNGRVRRGRKSLFVQQAIEEKLARMKPGELFMSTATDGSDLKEFQKVGDDALKQLTQAGQEGLKGKGHP